MFKMLFIPCLLFLIALLPSETRFLKQQEPEQQDENYKFVWLTQQDWHTLEKVTTRGKKTTAVVFQKTRLNIVHKVQYKHESVELTKDQREKMEGILSKYEKK